MKELKETAKAVVNAKELEGLFGCPMVVVRTARGIHASSLRDAIRHGWMDHVIYRTDTSRV